MLYSKQWLIVAFYGNSNCQLGGQMKVFLAFVLAWFNGLGHSHAITESKADAMQDVFRDLGKDEEESRKLAKTVMIDVHGFKNLVPIQMKTKANRLANKIRKRNRNIRFNKESIARLEAFIAGDEVAVAGFNVKKTAALKKQKEWS